MKTRVFRRQAVIGFPINLPDHFGKEFHVLGCGDPAAGSRTDAAEPYGELSYARFLHLRDRRIVGKPYILVSVM